MFCPVGINPCKGTLVVQLHHDLENLVQFHQELGNQITTQQINLETAAGMLAQRFVTDAEGARWTITPQGSFNRQLGPTLPAVTADPTTFQAPIPQVGFNPQPYNPYQHTPPVEPQQPPYGQRLYKPRPDGSFGPPPTQLAPLETASNTNLPEPLNRVFTWIDNNRRNVILVGVVIAVLVSFLLVKPANTHTETQHTPNTEVVTVEDDTQQPTTQENEVPNPNQPALP
ncbi:MAG: hypothetical protein WDA77_11115 [Acidimicrobiia bacterium]